MTQIGVVSMDKCLEAAEGFNWRIQYRSCKHYILPLCVYSTKVSRFTNWAFTGDGKKTFLYSLKHCYIKYAIFKRNPKTIVPNEAVTYMCVSLEYSCRSTAYFWFLFELYIISNYFEYFLVKHIEAFGLI